MEREGDKRGRKRKGGRRDRVRKEVGEGGMGREGKGREGVGRGRNRKGGRRNRETEKRIGRGRRERYRQRGGERCFYIKSSDEGSVRLLISQQIEQKIGFNWEAAGYNY
jgi:hypothetical protein